LAFHKSIIGFFLKWLFAILLAWLSVAIGWVLFHAWAGIPWGGKTTIVFLSGFILYLIIHFTFYKPILTHVLAHELTHALAAILMGGKVTAVHATTTGGSTMVNKSHFFISLAPYVFPFYTVITLGLYVIAAEPFKIYLVGFVGFTYAFHVALTVYSLSHPQSDLKDAGVAFSLIFILAGNMIGLMLLTSFVWPQVLPLSAAFSETYHRAVDLARMCFYLVKPHLFHREAPTP
jgi:hypothetical protein